MWQFPNTGLDTKFLLKPLHMLEQNKRYHVYVET